VALDESLPEALLEMVTLEDAVVVRMLEEVLIIDGTEVSKKVCDADIVSTSRPDRMAPYSITTKPRPGGVPER